MPRLGFIELPYFCPEIKEEFCKNNVRSWEHAEKRALDHWNVMTSHGVFGF